jgi:ABC-type multidrug transport system ATPase subunit/HAMP domain-containing protein
VQFRRRIVLSTVAVTAVALGVAFFAISKEFTELQESRLDGELVEVAKVEAKEAPLFGFSFNEGPGPPTNDVGPLTKHGVIYGDDDAPMSATAPFDKVPPSRATLSHPNERCFDFEHGGHHYRGVLVGIPGHPKKTVLLAALREDLDADERFLRDAMAFAFVVALAWAGVIASFVVRRFTREHQRIAEVANRVTKGDLSARVAARSGDPDVLNLARDVDEMIDTISALMTSQRRFLAHAAHELRSPITQIYGELQLAVRKDREAPELKKAILEALESTRALKNLTDDLLSLAKVTAGDTSNEECMLGSVVDNAVALSRPLAEERKVNDPPRQHQQAERPPDPLHRRLDAACRRGEKVGLVGPNGAGKTTLFRMITGRSSPTTARSRSIAASPSATSARTSARCRAAVRVVARTMAGAGPVSDAGRTSSRSSRDGRSRPADEMDELVERYGEVQARFEELGGYALEARAREVLAGLGFAPEHGRRRRLLSGGWKMRVALARILLMRPDVLLLDEPTNHLDLESILWLEGFLKGFDGALLMTSHDREFMNRIVTKIVEIDGGELTTYSGNYDFYEQQRALAEAQQEAQYERQQAMLAKEEAFIERFKARASHAAQVQSRVKKLDKIEKVEPPKRRADGRVRLPPPPRSGDDVAPRGRPKAYGAAPSTTASISIRRASAGA